MTARSLAASLASLPSVLSPSCLIWRCLVTFSFVLICLLHLLAFVPLLAMLVLAVACDGYGLCICVHTIQPHKFFIDLRAPSFLLLLFAVDSERPNLAPFRWSLSVILRRFAWDIESILGVNIIYKQGLFQLRYCSMMFLRAIFRPAPNSQLGRPWFPFQKFAVRFQRPC